MEIFTKIFCWKINKVQTGPLHGKIDQKYEWEKQLSPTRDTYMEKITKIFSNIVHKWHLLYYTKYISMKIYVFPNICTNVVWTGPLCEFISVKMILELKFYEIEIKDGCQYGWLWALKGYG